MILTAEQPTKARYSSIYSPEQGTIVVYDEYSPAYMKQTTYGLAVGILPSLEHFSDITFINWADLTKSNPAQRANLNYVFIRAINNLTSRRVIQEALKASQKSLAEPPPWPGKQFHRPTASKPGKQDDPFLALLGTENVKGVAWMLAQHQSQLGSRVIESITVWWDGQGTKKEPLFHMMVKIEKL